MMRFHDHYKGFSAEQFAGDGWFRQWIVEPDESAELYWTTYLQQNPGQAEVLQEARQLVETDVYTYNEARPLDEEERQSMKKDLFDRLNLSRSSDTSFSTPVKRLARRTMAAAAVLLLVAAVYLLTKNPLTGAGKSGLLAEHTGPGETRTILLPDSSVVVLNAGSSLEYSSALATAESREVKVSGNAFFRVKKGLSRFVVHTPQLSVTVLGTEFNVNARSAAEEVALVSGKVKVAGPYEAAEPVYLLPGDRVRLDTTARVLVASQVNASLYSAWTEGRWSFQQTTLEDIGRLVSAWYGTEVRFKSEKSKRCRITAVIPVDSLQKLIPVLQQTLHIAMNLSDNKVTIE